GTFRHEDTTNTWFDKLTTSARPEPVEGRALRVPSWHRGKRCAAWLCRREKRCSRPRIVGSGFSGILDDVAGSGAKRTLRQRLISTRAFFVSVLRSEERRVGKECGFRLWWW